MMKVITKVAMRKDHIEERLQQGLNEFELYTDLALLNDERNYEDIYNLVKLEKIRILSVHAPESLLQPTGRPKADWVDYNTFLDIDRDGFIRSCEFADKLGELQGFNVTIVLHASYDMEISSCTEILSKSHKYLNRVLDKYTYIDVVIENLSLGGMREYGYFWDVRRYVEQFLYAFPDKKDRVGVLLDTCHAIITKRTASKVPDITIDNDVKDLQEFVHGYQPYLRQIHLCNCIGDGEGRGKHGVKFDKNNTKDMKNLSSIFRNLRYINFDGIISLEIAEDIYPSSKNVLDTIEAIKVFITDEEFKQHIKSVSFGQTPKQQN